MPFKQNKILINLRKVKGFESGFHTLLPLSTLALQKKKANYFRNSLFSFRGPSWARTSDHLIMSQVL